MPKAYRWLDIDLCNSAPDCDDDWIKAIGQLRADPARRARYSAAARQASRQFHISAVAPKYMDLFRLAMTRHQASRLQPPLFTGPVGASLPI